MRLSRLAMLGALVACHRTPPATGDAPVGPDGDAAIEASADASADASTDAAPFSCATDTVIHFDVHPVAAGTIPDGRLIVDLYQLQDNLNVPEQVIYDVPFTGASTSVDLTLADLALPANLDRYKVCPRTCYDLSNPACTCTAGQPNVALAAVIVMVDADHSGAIEPAELTRDNRYGIGVMSLGDSDAAYPPPTFLDPLAPEGIQGCLAPYSILPPMNGSIFDRLGVPTSTTFPLDVCVPGSASCDMLRVPNLN
jgi:hypothetical protein